MIPAIRKEWGRVQRTKTLIKKDLNKSQKRYLEFSTRGGRASVAGIICTVFGSTGFLGRYTVNAFGSIGTQVVIPYRGDETSYTHLKVMGDIGQIVPKLWSIRDPDTIYEAVKHSDIVINLLGSKWNTRNFTLEDVHIDGARKIASISKAAGVERLIHVSTSDYNVDSDCDWIRTKSIGEDVVKENFPGATVLRPTILFGSEDNYTVRMGERMRFWPIFPLIYPERRVQPVYVNDVATAIIQCVKDNRTIGRTYELGGNEIWTNEEIFNYFNAFLKLKTKPIRGQEKLVEKLSHVLTHLPNPHFTPDSMKQEALDCVVKKGSLGFDDLGFDKDEVGSFEKISPICIRRFRKPIRFDEGIEVTYSGHIIDPRD